MFNIESLYIQGSLILVSFIFSYVVNKISQKMFLYKLDGLKEKASNDVVKSALGFLKESYKTIITICMLAASAGMAKEIVDQSNIILGLIGAMISLTVLRAIHRKTQSAETTGVIGFFLALFVALSVFDMLPAVTRYLDQASFSVGNYHLSIYALIKGVVLTLAFITLARFASKNIQAYIRGNEKLNVRTRTLASKMSDFAIYFITFLCLMNVMGIDLTTFAVLGGAVGVGVGFGLQKIAANFVSGLILLFEGDIEENDLVEIAGISGWVRKQGIRQTVIETFDGREVMIPNEDFVTSTVTNWTFNNTKARVTIPVGVSYDCDIRLAKTLIQEAAEEYCAEHIKDKKFDPSISCFLREFADSSVNFVLMFWVQNVRDGRYGPQDDVMFRIWDKLKANNIEIPYPQQDIHIKDMPAEAVKKGSKKK